jgi:hypothetical protein
MIEALLNLLFCRIDIKRDESPNLYLRRWFIYPRNPTEDKLCRRLYLHKFHRGDEDLHLHTHPWSYHTFILWGGYWERTFNPAWLKLKAITGEWDNGLSQTVDKWYGPGTFMKRGSKWSHQVRLPEGKTAWTIVFTSIKERSWGFITEGGLCNHKNYHNGVCWCEEGTDVISFK